MPEHVVSLIAAMTPTRAIGYHGTWPWSPIRLSADLIRFKKITKGHTVVMGRKTWEESLKKRPLPERRNIVMTRTPGLIADGCESAHSVEEAMEMTRGDGEVFVIGGGHIYGLFLPCAKRLYITEVLKDFAGDTFFPYYRKNEWRRVNWEFCPEDETNILASIFFVLER